MVALKMVGEQEKTLPEGFVWRKCACGVMFAVLKNHVGHRKWCSHSCVVRKKMFSQSTGKRQKLLERESAKLLERINRRLAEDGLNKILVK